MKQSKTQYNNLLENIGQAIEKARRNALVAVNTELVKANWEIGRHIVEFEQLGMNVQSMEQTYLQGFPGT